MWRLAVMHLYVNFQLNVKWAKFVSQPTLMLATICWWSWWNICQVEIELVRMLMRMLMTIVNCWTFARWGSSACTTCQELAATCRTTSRCKNWDGNLHNFVFGDIFGHNFGNWISIVSLNFQNARQSKFSPGTWLSNVRNQWAFSATKRVFVWSRWPISWVYSSAKLWNSFWLKLKQNIQLMYYRQIHRQKR